MNFKKLALLIVVLVSACITAFSQQFTLQIGSPAAPATTLVSHTNIWRFHKGTNAPQSGWQTNNDANLDSTWASGAGGFGYADNVPETANCGTLLPDMLNLYTTVYFRRAFQITSPIDPAVHLQLTMDY